MDKMRMESVDMTAQNIDKIEEMFPNCITETYVRGGGYRKAINFELLKQMLSDDIIEGDEVYEFTWVGKKASIVEASKPIRKTLRPCKEESVNWDSTENLYIEGDNLEVLKLLQESYLGKVKMIYIDPPYNTGNDFIYNDDFKMSREEYADEQGEYDDDGNRMFKNTDSNGRFHSDWCSMIYSRLMLARNLLRDDGVIFISIDDNEQENLKKICDEIFGESNFVGDIICCKGNAQNDAINIQKNHEYILVYAKIQSDLISENIEIKKEVYCDGNSCYYIGAGIVTGGAGGTLNSRPNLGYTIYYNKDIDDKIAVQDYYLDRAKISNNEEYVYFEDKELLKKGYEKIRPPKKGAQLGRWTWSLDKFNLEKDKILISETLKGYSVKKKEYVDFKNIYNEGEKKFFIDSKRTSIQSIFNYSSAKGTKALSLLFKMKLFNNSKNIDLIKKIISISTNKDSLVLDFFSGSSTTAHAAMQLNAEDGGNRKFIMVQLPEQTDEKSEAYKAGYKNICEIGKERIRRAGQKILKENENKEGIENLDIGFRVLKLDESNMTDVYYNPADYNQNLLSELESNIKSDRTDLDLLFGCLLEWGLPLSFPYGSEQIGDCTVHNYNDGDLIACFDENIPESVIKEIAKKQPLRAVFRDSSFADSPSKINVGEIFKLLAPDTRVKVI